MAVVSIPLLLSDVTGGSRQVEVTGATLAEIVTALDAVHPGIEARLLDQRKIKTTVAFVIDGRIAGQGLATPVAPDSQVNILPAFGGG